jgi:tRNA A-37 threonylcarbamoyl transferase component Bud32
MRLVPGEAFGRYRVEAEIGRGGQAVVYRATQVDLDRQVALKVFDEGYLTRAGAVERFRREAIAAGRLEHPRIVPVYDAGEVEGRAYISMRLVSGDTLAERLARGGALDPDEALAILGDIGEAIDFAHAQGTVHRDVKPGNILLDPAGAAFLSDFGLVRLDDMPGLTRRGDWLGTAEYVSPEQVEGEPATAASDVYALAAVAFEALTGRAPYVRREPSAVLLAHVRDPVPYASSLGHGLTTPVDRALAHGLAKDPSQRPTRAGDLIDELRAALEPRPDPPVEPAAEERVTNDGEEAPARGRLASIPNPWEAALARFRRAPATPHPAGDRPTQAFGDAARRRAMALGRDVAVVAAVGGAFLLAGAGIGGWIIGSSQADASGAEARGYEQGRESGQKAGFAAGKREGLEQGRAAGIRTGRAQGRKTGFAAGRNTGEEEGRASGYASGYAEGRSTALGGLAAGGWYVLRIGSDENGPVVSGATPLAPGSCYALNGGSVMSGPC